MDRGGNRDDFAKMPHRNGLIAAFDFQKMQVKRFFSVRQRAGSAMMSEISGCDEFFRIYRGNAWKRSYL